MSAIAKLSRASLAATALLSAAPAAAEETCTTVRHGQFFNAMQYCVSSVLAPQGENSYGPANLTGWQANSAKAWCEGVPGHGIGETITIRTKARLRSGGCWSATGIRSLPALTGTMDGSKHWRSRRTPASRLW